MSITSSQSDIRTEPAEVDLLLTVKEAATLMSASVPTFWRWAAKGIVPQPIKLGGLSRWPKSEIIAVIEAAKLKRGTLDA